MPKTEQYVKLQVPLYFQDNWDVPMCLPLKYVFVDICFTDKKRFAKNVGDKQRHCFTISY